MNIEHDPVEIDDSHVEAGLREQAQGPGPTAHDVILACLVEKVPCPACGSTEACRCIKPPDYSEMAWRATLVERSLIMYGHLPDPRDVEAPVFSPEEVAQWLAHKSAFMRYTEVKDGWRRLLEAEIDVDLAAAKALQRVGGDEVALVNAAKASLLAWHAEGRPTSG